jgi:hypothetical protein
VESTTLWETKRGKIEVKLKHRYKKSIIENKSSLNGA